MNIKQKAETLVNSAKELFDSNNPKTMIFIRSIDEINHKVKVELIKKKIFRQLNTWNFPEELTGYLDYLMLKNEMEWEYRKEIADDSIPLLSPWFGIAEHSAFIGGNVSFTEETSWHHPFLDDWGKLNSLELNENNCWIRMIVDGLQYLKNNSRGNFYIRLRGSDGPMDIANALRGNDIYTDFYDYPNEVHQLMEFSLKAARWTLEKQKQIVGQFEGGVFIGSSMWVPGNSIGHLSEDTSVSCSTSIYEEFGLPYTERLIELYDHNWLHVHPAGKHNIISVSRLKKMDCIDICNDPNSPSSMNIYKELSDTALSDKIVAVRPTFDEIKENLDFLKERKTVLDCYVETIDQAKSIVELVKEKLNY